MPYGQSDWFEVASRFALSKTHPGVATIANLLNGVDLMGNEASLQTELGKMVGPITYFDIYQAFKAQGVPEATALSILAFLGEGLQTYNPNKKQVNFKKP